MITQIIKKNNKELEMFEKNILLKDEIAKVWTMTSIFVIPVGALEALTMKFEK